MMKRRRPDSPKAQPSTSEREREASHRLDLLIHDLRNCFSAIRFAQYFLDDKLTLTTHQQATYQAVLRSNLSQATGLMDQLLQAAPVPSTQADPTAPSPTAFLRHVSGQLPSSVDPESADLLAHLKKLVDIGLQGG